MELQAIPIIPFRLHNISDFRLKDGQPSIHPELPQYNKYWKEQFSYCIYGKWGHDYDSLNKVGGWRWMPGNLYFYINMTVITDEGDDGTEEEINPLLRDVEWFVFYALAECDGFAGFDGDDERSCYRPLGKLQRGEELSSKEKIFLDKYDSYLRKPNGEYKDYVEARDMLYSTYDKPLGNPLWFNENQDLMIMSSRGVGKSYITSNGFVLHDFVMNGAKDLEGFLSQDTKSTTVVGSADSSKSKELLDKFKTAYEYLRTSVGNYEKSNPPEQGIFWRPTTGTLGIGAETPFTNKVKLKGGVGTTGPGSKIVHVTYQKDPSAGVGYRARRMVVEEVGLVNNFKTVHGENQASMTRKTRFGYCVYIGTGGQVEKTIEVQDAFENPRAYNILPFEDKFSKVDREIGLFIPVYYRNSVYLDENGNTDIQAAFEDEIKERERKRESSEIAYERHCISYPIVPQEMFLASTGNPFPTGSIDDRLAELNAGAWKKKAQVGNIDYIDPSRRVAQFKVDKNKRLKPIVNWRQERNMIEGEIEGAFVIYEPPVRYRPELHSYNPLYIIAYDPVLREDGGSSLCVVTVFKMFHAAAGDEEIQFNIVAEWIGRYNDTDNNHEQAFKLSALYGAKILSEDNINGILRYARATNREDLLELRPDKALNSMTSQKKKNKYGIRVLPGMIPSMEKVLVDLVDLNVVNEEEREYLGEDGVETRYKKMVEECYSIRFLEEMKFYSRDGNSDYVSAMFMVAVWVKEIETRPLEDYNESRNKRNKTQDVMDFIRKRNRYKSPVSY